jgi:hypothetical protein
MLKSDCCSQDEVLAPSDTWPGHHPGASLSFQQATSNQGVRFDKVVTGLLGLSGPTKRDVRSVQIKACHQGQNDRSIINTDGGYHTGTSAQPQYCPRPSLLSVPLIPPVALPGLGTVINITSTQHIQDILLVYKKRGPICEWDLPLHFYRRLATMHSTSSH